MLVDGENTHPEKTGSSERLCNREGLIQARPDRRRQQQDRLGEHDSYLEAAQSGSLADGDLDALRCPHAEPTEQHRQRQQREGVGEEPGRSELQDDGVGAYLTHSQRPVLLVHRPNCQPDEEKCHRGLGQEQCREPVFESGEACSSGETGTDDREALSRQHMTLIGMDLGDESDHVVTHGVPIRLRVALETPAVRPCQAWRCHVGGAAQWASLLSQDAGRRVPERRTAPPASQGGRPSACAPCDP